MSSQSVYQFNAPIHTCWPHHTISFHRSRPPPTYTSTHRASIALHTPSISPTHHHILANNSPPYQPHHYHPSTPTHPLCPPITRIQHLLAHLTGPTLQTSYIFRTAQHHPRPPALVIPYLYLTTMPASSHVCSRYPHSQQSTKPMLRAYPNSHESTARAVRSSPPCPRSTLIRSYFAGDVVVLASSSGVRSRVVSGQSCGWVYGRYGVTSPCLPRTYSQFSATSAEWKQERFSRRTGNAAGVCQVLNHASSHVMSSRCSISHMPFPT